MVVNHKSLFISVSELALMFGWKRNFIHRGIAAGRIPGRAEGQRYFIPRVWAERYYYDSVKGLDTRPSSADIMEAETYRIWASGGECRCSQEDYCDNPNCNCYVHHEMTKN